LAILRRKLSNLLELDKVLIKQFCTFLTLCVDKTRDFLSAMFVLGKRAPRRRLPVTCLGVVCYYMPSADKPTANSSTSSLVFFPLYFCHLRYLTFSDLYSLDFVGNLHGIVGLLLLLHYYYYIYIYIAQYAELQRRWLPNTAFSLSLLFLVVQCFSTVMGEDIMHY